MDGADVLPGRDAGDPVGDVDGDPYPLDLHGEPPPPPNFHGFLCIDHPAVRGRVVPRSYAECDAILDARRPLVPFFNGRTFDIVSDDFPLLTIDDQRHVHRIAPALSDADSHAAYLRGQDAVRRVRRRGVSVGNFDAGYLPTTRNGEVVPAGEGADERAVADVRNKE